MLSPPVEEISLSNTTVNYMHDISSTVRWTQRDQISSHKYTLSNFHSLTSLETESHSHPRSHLLAPESLTKVSILEPSVTLDPEV